MSGAEPLRPHDRHDIVDSIRGFALFGVLLSNITWTALWSGTPPEQLAALPTQPLDDLFDLFGLVFIESKFYTIFSMLFGFGLAMQLASAQRRGTALSPLYRRRMGLLFLFGAVHATLIWFGDILHIYAINGLILLALSRYSNRTLLKLAAAIAIFASLLPTIDWLTTPAPTAADLEMTTAGIEEAPQEEDDLRYLAMKHGSYADIVARNIEHQKRDYSNISISGADSITYWYLSVLWKFLLGFCIGRAGILQNLAAHRARIRRLLPWAFAIGLAGNAIYASAMVGWDLWLFDPDNAAALLTPLVEIGILALALAYAGTLALCTDRRWVRALAPMGRMALTQYLMQSALYLILLYGIGFGLIGEIGTSACISIGVAIYGLQVASSAWWLKRYRFGPFEWLWRSLTYGKRQPMRRTT